MCVFSLFLRRLTLCCKRTTRIHFEVRTATITGRYNICKSLCGKFTTQFYEGGEIVFYLGFCERTAVGCSFLKSTVLSAMKRTRKRYSGLGRLSFSRNTQNQNRPFVRAKDRSNTNHFTNVYISNHFIL